jgi:hypothetical protein
MTDDSAGSDQGDGRLPYVKPFVRNLDAVDTQGGKNAETGEFTTGLRGTLMFGPS